MCAEALFENLTTLGNRFESLPCCFALTIISPQIAERLFALKDRYRSNLLRRQSIRGDVGTIPAVWQTHFHRARGITLGLCPQKCQALQPSVSLSFAVAAFYSRSHLANWPVESRREFRRVTTNRRLDEASLIERRANRTDATVHHVARCHDVRTSCSLRERRLHQPLNSLVVENLEMISVDACHTTVPMTHVLTQADIGDGDKLWTF